MGLTKIRDKFYAPVSGQSLAMFRILYGFLIVWDVVLDLFYGESEILRKFVGDNFHLKHYLFSWVQAWPEQWMAYLHYFALLFAGIGVMLGWYYRIAIIATVLLFSYIFFIDMTYYLNHYYLMIVIGILLAFLPANKEWSVDMLRHPEWKDKMVPHWSVWSARSFVEVMLIYAGLVKLNPDWLRLEPLGMWLRSRAEWHFFGDLVYHDWFVAMGAYGTVALHILGAPLLFFKKTRLPVFIVYCCFHLMNSYTFDIGVFPFLAIFVTLIFFPPDWPETFYRWVLIRIGRFKSYYEAKRLGKADNSARWHKLALSCVVIFLVVQILLPLRSLLYPGNVAWTQEGHQFAWRMKLNNLRNDAVVFKVHDPVSGKTWGAYPDKFLPFNQAREVSTNPEYAVQFAHLLEKIWAKDGYKDVEVYAEIYNSLNGRKPALFLDPHQDLTKVEWSFAASPWIMPLEEPFLKWGGKKGDPLLTEEKDD